MPAGSVPDVENWMAVAVLCVESTLKGCKFQVMTAGDALDMVTFALAALEDADIYSPTLPAAALSLVVVPISPAFVLGAKGRCRHLT